MAVTLLAILALPSQLPGNASEDSAVRSPQNASVARNEPDLTRRYLAVDRSLHADVQNMRLVMDIRTTKAQSFGGSLDEPWEAEHQLQLGALGSVFRDHEGRYRMYYEVMLNNEKRATALALSDDGHPVDQAATQPGSVHCG